MRTTWRLEDDVAAELRKLRARTGRPFEQLLNEVLRLGLAQLGRKEQRPSGPFTQVVSLGRPRFHDIDDVSETLAAIEGDDQR